MATYNKKNLYCRDARANEIIAILGESPFKTGKGCHIRECPYGIECKGAHRKEEIQYYPHILKWHKLNKSSFNFIDVYNEILKVILFDKNKITTIPENFNKIKIINELTFIELVQLWHDLACFYRKLNKKNSRDDFPNFNLSDEIEDHCWAFVRMTVFCNTHKTFRENYSRKQKMTIWDICLGDKNCKEGVHNINEYLCYDDFLTGKCNCIPKEVYDKEKQILNDKVQMLQKNILENKDENKLKVLKIKLNNALGSIADYQRKIHYTDEGMIPFNIQHATYKNKLAIKEEETKVIGKVIKISLKKK